MSHSFQRFPVHPTALILGLSLLFSGAAGAEPRMLIIGRGATAPPAQRLMDEAKRHEYGVGVKQDLDRAVALYCQASAAGDPEASYHLGWLYLTGRLGKVDEVLAAAWFQSAAGASHARAREQLARLDAQGRALDQAAQCVARGQMIARRLPRAARPEAPAAAPATGETAVAAVGVEGVTIRDPGRRDLIALVRRLAPDYGLDPELVLAVIEAESNFNPQARSSKNAQGLMQLIPETARRFGVTDVWDPVQNMRGGMAYLRWLLKHFDGNVSLALAGYNAGENAVVRHGGVPPYPETRAYVARINRSLARTANRGTAPTAVAAAASRAEPTSAPPPGPRLINIGIATARQ